VNGINNFLEARDKNFIRCEKHEYCFCEREFCGDFDLKDGEKECRE